MARRVLLIAARGEKSLRLEEFVKRMAAAELGKATKPAVTRAEKIPDGELVVGAPRGKRVETTGTAVVAAICCGR